MIRAPLPLALLLPPLLGCDPGGSAPPADDAVAPYVDRAEEPAADGLERVLALARACAGSAPHQGLGRDGSPLLLDGHLAISEADAGLWRVHFTEEEPTSAAYGLPVLVDPLAGTCDGRPVPAPATRSGPSLAALFDAAEDCGEDLARGLGVGGSPLVSEGISLSLRPDGRLVFSLPEEAPRTRPSGRDLSLDDTGGGCRLEAMD